MGGSSYFASLARRVREAEASSDAAFLKELHHRNDPETIMLWLMWIGLTKVSCLRHCTEVKRQESQLRKLSNSAAQLHRTSLYVGRGVHELSSSAGTSTMGGSSYFASLARRVREAEASSDAAYLKELHHRNDPETIMLWLMWIGLTKVSCLRHCTEVKRQESQLRKLSNSAAQLHRTSLYAGRRVFLEFDSFDVVMEFHPLVLLEMLFPGAMHFNIGSSLLMQEQCDQRFIHVAVFSIHPFTVVEHKRLLIENSHGEKLVGILHETGSTELVVICHGFRSSKRGISAFRFDFAGNGESEGSFQYGNYRREAEDLRSVVEQFQAEQRLIVALIGTVKEGVECYEASEISEEFLISFITAPIIEGIVFIFCPFTSIFRYKDIHTIVNIAGRFNLRRGIEGRLGKTEYRVTKESLMDRLATDTRAACQTIPLSCRVLTIHGTLDEFVPVEDAHDFAKYIPNHKLCIVEGADHEYTKHQSELASTVLNFVKTGPHKDSRL
ncbi:hypothetical protein Sango_2211300 [Sesamum angolense]|uniref:Serine aminopeptidase S33 domain-containing protein n=1 Tax=Sesamum angolense TaxID=2727404 RepID=A0AAE2BKH8_9LAMI|nr:hypothetical protein Sango_2211300 [Sesamum angolense]